MNELLDISERIDLSSKATLVAVDSVMSSLSITYIVVGAAARDMALRLGYGTPTTLATKDIDFALQVDSWGSFYDARSELINVDFKATQTEHRLISPNKIPIDIVPFGKIELLDGKIAWPPKGEQVMNMRGFKEANENAQPVLISKSPDITCRVVSPEGLMLLKFIAWIDRPREIRGKDAGDISYLLNNYLLIKNVSEDIHNSSNEPDKAFYGWDPDLSAACLLGKECRLIAISETLADIQNLFDDDEKISLMVAEMKNGRPEINYQLLQAFADGLLERRNLN